ncbi:MAG: OmpA family protein [Candidatus Gastranaerophilales bacterium]|nr:OmpA family protein [Candidatus Gastranaerophilales bacterium]
MRFYRQPSNQDSGENIFWISMSDLFQGLLILFVILFALSITGLSKQNLDQATVKNKIYQKLSMQFKEQGIPVEIDKFSGNIKILDLELFELNKWTISERGKKFLDKMIPTYLNTLLGDPEIEKHISQIIIEGHTDSQSFKKSTNKYDNYNKNLDLSLKRAYAVTEYIVNHDFPQKNKYKNHMIAILSTNGKSFSDPVMVNGKEEFKKSRRVELKFQLTSYNFLDLIGKYKVDKK